MSQNCTLFDSKIQGYDDEDCSAQFCSACDFEKDILFKLKGICLGSTKIDSDYFLTFDRPLPGHFFLWGFTGLTSIYYNLNGEFANSWIINSGKRNGSYSTLGYYNDSSSQFPLGLKNWNMRTTCEVISNTFSERNLKITKVNNGDFLQKVNIEGRGQQRMQSSNTFCFVEIWCNFLQLKIDQI